MRYEMKSSPADVNQNVFKLIVVEMHFVQNVVF